MDPLAEILSQSEIDSLIRAMASGDLAPSQPQATASNAPSTARPAESGTLDKRIRVYDFRRPDKFSKDQLRTLSMVHDNFTRYLSTYFSANFRTAFSLFLTSVDQMTYGEFTRTLSEPTIMSIFSMPPLKGNAIMDISPSIAFPMIDRLLGGHGQGLEKLRPLTEIESSVMERVIKGFLDALAEAWCNIIDTKPRLEAVETNPSFSQVVPPNEICVGILVEVKLGEHKGPISLCVPYIMIEPVVNRLSAHNWFTSAKRESSPAFLTELNRRLSDASVLLSAVLGEVELTVRELIDLEAGDVVLLNRAVDQEISLLVGNRPKFAAIPGTLNDRMALRVTQIQLSEEDTDEQ